MSTFRPKNSARIGHFEGELLAARDLQDDVTFESQLRGLHVRAMHNTWGVALGYDVSLVGGNRLQVGPGIAYDCRGQEIVSSHTLTVGLPVLPVGSQAAAWWFDLVIRYNDLATLLGGRDGNQSGCRGSEERPAWRWVFAADAVTGAGEENPPPLEVAPAVRLGEEVPLVRARISAKRTITRLDFGVRRHAQGLVRPHMAGGQVTGALTFDAEVQAFPLAVNTAAGGFNGTPLYFARAVIPAFLKLGNAQGGAALRRILGPFVSIRAPSRTGFTLDLRIGITGDDGVINRFGDLAAAVAPRAENLITVDWIGIESNAGCAPPQQFLPLLLFLSGGLTSLNRRVEGSLDEQQFSGFGTTGLF